ncbi:FeoA family protein [Parvularcula lutaonensis]|uniref:Ferrous iron transport protein A n=1 Tax=Parvularcula lutaonensis TaxID=491923 RepID=A0ABV7MAV9_9PROT|nr:FeoA family protein [Parvularcula lutaonensis]GGY45712.1 hypothetical protein GCM10007148_13420 [Parvularcula lutaonensis]
MSAPIPLPSLKNGQKATILALRGEDALTAQLADNGFVPGEAVWIVRRGLIGGTPLAVQLGRAVIALRRDEALAIEVEPA